MYVFNLKYMYGQEKGVERVSPRTGRPTKNPKNVRFEIRMTQEQSNMLEECAKKLKTSKTEVINKGVQLVKKELDNKKE